MAEARVERRLAAILATDVAGYSRLMGIDEEGTLARLKAHRSALVDPMVNEYRGRIVKTTGDGLLVEFASVVDAVRCALDVQRGMAERNTDIPQEKRIEFRIGINVGDIIVDGSDIFGDGVNVAARLEGLAEPGGIFVSSRVQEDVQGRIDVNFEDAGEQTLKNIARPVRVYRVRPNEAAAKTAPALADKPSIAVLPFTNMSGDPEQEYFADGMVEEVITGLSRIKWLTVISRNSSFIYKNKPAVVNRRCRRSGDEHGVRSGRLEQRAVIQRRSRHSQPGHLDGVWAEAEPIAVAVDPRAGSHRLFVALYGGGLDHAQNSGVDVIPLEPGPTACSFGGFGAGVNGVAFNPNTEKLYASAAAAPSVAVAAGPGNCAVTADVAVDDKPASVAVDVAANRVYAPIHTDDELAVIDGGTDALLRRSRCWPATRPASRLTASTTAYTWPKTSATRSSTWTPALTERVRTRRRT